MLGAYSFFGMYLSLQPRSSRFTGWALPMSPKVGVGMDDRTLWGFEDFFHGDGKKGEVAELGVIFEIIIFVSAYKNRASL